jgi:hypothetical protein
LHCSLLDDNGMTLQLELPTDHRFAVVQRLVRPATSDAANETQPDNESPMARLAQALYRDAGAPHIDGSASLTPVDAPRPIWPTVTCNR